MGRKRNNPNKIITSRRKLPHRNSNNKYQKQNRIKSPPPNANKYKIKSINDDDHIITLTKINNKSLKPNKPPIITNSPHNFESFDLNNDNNELHTVSGNGSKKSSMTGFSPETDEDDDDLNLEGLSQIFQKESINSNINKSLSQNNIHKKIKKRKRRRGTKNNHNHNNNKNSSQTQSESSSDEYPSPKRRKISQNKLRNNNNHNKEKSPCTTNNESNEESNDEYKY